MLVPFEILPGLFSDDTAFAMPGAWETGSNIRFRLGRPQVIGGWAGIVEDTLTGVCRNVFAWNSVDAIVRIAFGTHSALQVVSGGGLYDITPSGLAAGEIDSSSGSPGYGSGPYGEGTWSDPSSIFYARTWSLANYGSDLIANPRGGTIYSWDGDTGNLAVAVTNAPSIVTASLVTPERQLLALGCNEEISGDFNPLCIRGSDIEDITDWTTSPSNNAFEQIIEGGGRIVNARMVGSYLAVWTDRGLHLGQFLGNPGQTYRFDVVADNCGLASANALAVFDQTVVWLAPDYQFRIWTLGGVPEVLTCPILGDFRDNLQTAQVDKVAAAALTQFGEVWFHYPDTRDDADASRYVAFAYRETLEQERSVWFKGELARTAAADAGATNYPLRVTYDGMAYYHESGTTAAGDDLDWYLQSSDTYLEEGGRVMMIRRLVPDFEEQDSDVMLTLFTRRYPMAAPETYGPYTLSPGHEKTDFRARGKIAAARFAGAAYARLGRPVFDMMPMGQR